MNRRFAKYMRIVGACHVGVLVIMLTTSGWTGAFKRTPDTVPVVEFVVEVPGEPVKDSKIPILDPLPKIEPKIEPKVEPAEPEDDNNTAAINVDTGKKKKKGVQKSNKKVTRIKGASTPAGGGGGQKLRMTPEELRRYLDMGAKMSDHTSIPGDEESRCFAIVHRTMYEAWNQPGAEDAANAVAEVTIGLSRDGMVLWRKLSKQSGNSVFDDSVMRGVNSVQYIEHLTPAFLDKYREVRITFKLE